MKNSFVESEETNYIEVIGDPVYDTYGEDYEICIKNQVSQDIVVQHGVQNSIPTNPRKDGVLLIRLEIFALIQAHHVMVDGIKSKSLVGGLFLKTKGLTAMIGYMDKNNMFYICFLFIYVKIKDVKFHQWKRIKILFEDHG